MYRLRAILRIIFGSQKVDLYMVVKRSFRVGKFLLKLSLK